MEEMDKLLEELQKVSVEFNNQLSKYEALIYHTKRTNEKLEKYTDSNRDKVDRLCIRVENKLGEMNQQVGEITKQCQEIFHQYPIEVASLNQEEREAFSALLLRDLEEYKKEFLQDVLPLQVWICPVGKRILSEIRTICFPSVAMWRI